MIRWIGALALAMTLTGPAHAACRLALALALDVSSSVDAREYRLQLDGLAGALLDPDVQDAIFAMSPVNVRFMVYEWGDANSQRVLVDWVEAETPADVEALANRLRATRADSGRDATGLGRAIEFGARALQTQSDCWQLTLDTSGDGPNNDGPEPALLRDSPAMARVTVNALVVSTDSTYAGVADRRQAEIKELLSYFHARVITGPMAFAEVALSFEDFEASMRRKLLRELAGLAVSDLGPNASDIATRARLRTIDQ